MTLQETKMIALLAMTTAAACSDTAEHASDSDNPAADPHADEHNGAAQLPTALIEHTRL